MVPWYHNFKKLAVSTSLFPTLALQNRGSIKDFKRFSSKLKTRSLGTLMRASLQRVGRWNPTLPTSFMRWIVLYVFLLKNIPCNKVIWRLKERVLLYIVGMYHSSSWTLPVSISLFLVGKGTKRWLLHTLLPRFCCKSKQQRNHPKSCTKHHWSSPIWDCHPTIANVHFPGWMLVAKEGTTLDPSKLQPLSRARDILSPNGS